jgi:hypothetical protein
MLALVWLKKEHWRLQSRILKAMFSLFNDTAEQLWTIISRLD